VDEYAGRQYVGVDLHRRHSVIVRMTPAGDRLGAAVRIDNDPFTLAQLVASWGESPEVVLEATYGWYWAADVLAEAGAVVHLAHPLGVKGFAYRRVKNDERDAGDLADLLRMGRLPEAWIAPPATRELRELVRHRAKLVAIRSGLKAQVHAVLAKQGVRVAASDVFGAGGQRLLDELRLDAPYAARVDSLRRLIDAFTFEIDVLAQRCPCRIPRPSRSRGMLVLVENAAEAVASSYVEAGYLGRIGDLRGQRAQRAGVRDALVRAVFVVKLFELAEGIQQVPLVPDQSRVQQFTAAGLNPPLHDGVHPRHPDATEHDLDARVGEDDVEQLRKLAVADQVPGPATSVLEVHDEVLRGLYHPCGRRMRGGAQNPDPTAGMLDHREHVHPRSGQGDRLEEVACQQGVGLGA